jgi:hypothetical protein
MLNAPDCYVSLLAASCMPYVRLIYFRCYVQTCFLADYHAFDEEAINLSDSPRDSSALARKIFLLALFLLSPFTQPLSRPPWPMYLTKFWMALTSKPLSCKRHRRGRRPCLSSKLQPSCSPRCASCSYRLCVRTKEAAAPACGAYQCDVHPAVPQQGVHPPTSPFLHPLNICLLR